MLVIKANLNPETEKAIRNQAEKAGLALNAYLTPVLNAVGSGQLEVSVKTITSTPRQNRKDTADRASI